MSTKEKLIFAQVTVAKQHQKTKIKMPNRDRDEMPNN